MTRARDLADLAGAADAGTVAGQSLIINGDMAVAQRGTSSAAHTTGYPCVDRFKSGGSLTTGAVTMSQSTDAPDGFTYSLKMDVTTANTSLAAGEYYIPCTHVIEAQNLQHLNYGTSEAKQFTVSFWVKSNKTGTYTLEAYNQDSTTYLNIKPYTINDADTWEYKTITFEANTNTAATIANDNGAGFYLNWWVAAGSTFNDGTGTLLTGWNTLTNNKRATGVPNMMDSTDNEWLITGVKLEVGDTATPFLHESYAENLRKCRRYFYSTDDSGSLTNYITGDVINSTSAAMGGFVFPTQMRSVPSVSFLGTNVTKFYSTATGTDNTISISGNRCSKDVGAFLVTGFTGATAGQAATLYDGGSGSGMAFDSEL